MNDEERSPVPVHINCTTGTDSICSAIRYWSPQHEHLPHVVKFSGGRSSAALTLSLARSGALKAARGDVVLFANTTAEHPATYDFAARVCDDLETEHGLPCLWYEFCTVETAGKRGWTRTQTYRLVSRSPASASDDPAIPGYNSMGAAFEELASWKGMLPNRSLRFCTQHLKVIPGIELIADWLGGGPGPPHAGHHHNRSLLSSRELAGRYNGDRYTHKEYEQARSFVCSQDWWRPTQQWSDFTTVVKRSDGSRLPADVFAKSGPAFQYVTLLGLRADEPKRVRKAVFEAMLADGATTSQCRHDSHPAGEKLVAPLYDCGATKADVDAFWRRQPYDLDIDGERGNCVYCFMKGESVLRRLAAAETNVPPSGGTGPSRIAWWADIEKRYAGASDDPQAKQFKFLSLRASSYTDIAADPAAKIDNAAPSLPCACTD